MKIFFELVIIILIALAIGAAIGIPMLPITDAARAIITGG